MNYINVRVALEDVFFLALKPAKIQGYVGKMAQLFQKRGNDGERAGQGYTTESGAHYQPCLNLSQLAKHHNRKDYKYDRREEHLHCRSPVYRKDYASACFKQIL